VASIILSHHLKEKIMAIKKLVVSKKITKELYECVCDILDADGDLYAMDFQRYRKALKLAEEKP
jgi:hypothetical protein